MIRAVYGVTVEHLSAAEDADYEIVSAGRSQVSPLTGPLSGLTPDRWDVLLREKSLPGLIYRRWAHGAENTFHLFESFDVMQKTWRKKPDPVIARIIENAFLEFSEKRRLLREIKLYREHST